MFQPSTFLILTGIVENGGIHESVRAGSPNIPYFMNPSLRLGVISMSR